MIRERRDNEKNTSRNKEDTIISCVHASVRVIVLGSFGSSSTRDPSDPSDCYSRFALYRDPLSRILVKDELKLDQRKL